MNTSQTGIKYIDVYGVHLTHNNHMYAVTQKSFLDLTKKHKAAYVQNGLNPVMYLASFVLPTRKRQSEFCQALKARGYDVVEDITPGQIPADYIGNLLPTDWLED